MSENDALKALEEYRSQVEDTEEYIERFDILETVTNVGNDEVFTPRKVCTQMLDALPKEVWSNPNYRWLNPSTKNGVFEREIALRLNEGLKDAIPDEETRKKHILQDMIYSIGLTKFTSLVARRTLYYCCHANRKDDGLKDIGDHHSLNGHAIGNGTWFPDEEGNIKTPHAEHSFKKSRENWKCEFCGLSKENSYNSPGQIEHYAYEFIHHPAALLPDYLSHLFFGGNKDMKFDIIIGNPPYQLNDGGSKASASPIYQKFVQRAMELRPKYLAMIIPSRWMQAGKGLDDFRALMKSSHQFRVFHDFFSSKQCFPSSIAIEGGVCYFVWDRDYEGKCECVWHGVKGREERDFCYLGEDDCDIVLRGPLDRSIRRKVETVSLRLKSEGLIDESSFSKLISSTKPYGFRTDFIKNPEKYGLKPALSSPVDRGYRILGFAKKQIVGFLPPDYVFPENMRERESLSKFKIFFGSANGGMAFKVVLPSNVIAEPTLGNPGDCCTETYLQIGPFDSGEERDRCFGYIKTRFFRFLLGIAKISQHISQEIFEFVPLPVFSKGEVAWGDDEFLYRLFDLSEDEIEYIKYCVADVSGWTGRGLLNDR